MKRKNKLENNYYCKKCGAIYYGEGTCQIECNCGNIIEVEE